MILLMFQVTFVKPMTVGRLVIAGNEISGTPQYVKTFNVSYSIDGVNYEAVTDPMTLTQVRYFT